MNRLYSFAVFIFLFLFSHSVFAETCSVAGNKDYVVQFQVVGSNDYQDVAFSHGNGNNQKKFVLWYTQQERSGDYSFNEQGLILGHTYTVRIEVEHTTGNSNIANYYWVENGVKVFKETQNDVAANGALEGTGTNISNLECGESVDLPEPEEPELPEQCAVFPHVVQSWDSASTLDISQGDPSIFGTANAAGSVGFGSINQHTHWQLACDSLLCSTDPALLISEPAPIPFSSGASLPFDPSQLEIPEGKYDDISDTWRTYTLTGTYYEISNLSLLGSATLKVKPNTFIKVNKFILDGSASIESDTGGDPVGLVIWAETESNQAPKITFSSSTNLYADLFSRDNVTISGGAILKGSVTAKNINMAGRRIERVADSDVCDPTTPPTTDYSLSLTPAQGIQLTCTAQQLDFQVKDSSGNNTGAYTGDIEVTATGGTNTSFNVLQGSPQGGNLYKANSNGLLSLSMDENTVSDVVVTGSLQDDPSATSVTGNYKFVAYKLGFSPNPTNIVAGKPSENVSVQPLECLNDAPVVSADYNGAKQVELSATNYIAPSSTVRPSEVIKVNGSTTPQGSMNLDFGSNSTANIQVEYAEAGSVSYTMTDEICIDDGQGSQECREYSGEHQIQSRPWTFALCEPSGADISGTSNSGSVFKRSGELFALNVTPIHWVSNESTAPNVAIDVSNYCNQLDTLETKNFYADSAPAVSVNLSAVLDSPSAGELGSGLEGIPPNGLAHNTNPIAFSSLFWKEAGSLKVTADLTNQADYLFEPINPGYRTVGRFSPSQLVMLDEISDPSNVWTQWQYASNHDGFAYMSQQFPHSFKVQAQANDGTPTLNYGLFGNDYISTLDYMANTTGLATDVSLLNRVANTQTWTGADWPKTLAENPSILSVQMDDFAFMKKVDSTVGSFIATEPDGPFNSSNSIFGLEVTTIIDDVNFSVLDMPDVNTGTNVGSAFPEQPEFRYGRMHLEDVGGNTGQTIRVPLRVEYWDDGEFKTNDKDSGSEYDATNHYCVQTIWNNQSATTNAALVSGGNHSVAQGLSDELHAEHVPTNTANTERAQVRLWLRQADDSPQRSETNIDCSKATSFTNQPWLQYNWRDKGDEDPSAVVTFGVFRGNDRIIFKGERALIGNEN
ncbi:DUF6701 domain-containing protein [Vibrio sp. B1Z05]|uniref:DUF6701 domain-containing protein n=1 Tax=Vibrio sp. B1Z05 TaxID=2654980 RepID=UPI00128C3BCF|nr:DUF6701 domain-containing protein [Vibrio sp. B1Z05]MPW36917.1 hypothetical protein [Vibrio sp. B1Z05]